MKNIFITILLFLILESTSSALIQVDINRGNLNPLPIAVSPLFNEKGSIEFKVENK